MRLFVAFCIVATINTIIGTCMDNSRRFSIVSYMSVVSESDADTAPNSPTNRRRNSHSQLGLLPCGAYDHVMDIKQQLCVIKHTTIIPLEQIGSGTYGTVFRIDVILLGVHDLPDDLDENQDESYVVKFIQTKPNFQTQINGEKTMARLQFALSANNQSPIPHVAKIIQSITDVDVDITPESKAHNLIAIGMEKYYQTVAEFVDFDKKQQSQDDTNFNFDFTKWDSLTVLQFVVKMAVQMCESVRAIHSHGIVLRDIKINNIMIEKRFDEMEPISSPDVQFRLIDFGECMEFINSTSKDEIIKKLQQVAGTPITVKGYIVTCG